MYALRILVGIRDIQSFPGGFDTFFGNPWSIRNAYGRGEVPTYLGRGIMLDLGGIGMSSLVVAGYLLATSSKKSIFFFLPLLMAVIDSTLNTQRALAIRTIVYFVVSFLYSTAICSNGSIKAKDLIRYALLALFIFAVFLSATIVMNESVFLRASRSTWESVNSKIENPVIEMAYWYFVGATSAFDHSIRQSNHELKMGACTFQVLAVGLANLGLVDERALPPRHGKPVTVMYTTNIRTYFNCFYEDLGLLGIAGFPFVFGVLCSLTYWWMRQRFSLSWLALNSVLAMAIFMSFAGFMLTSRQPLLLVIAVHLVEQVVARRFTLRISSRRQVLT